MKGEMTIRATEYGFGIDMDFTEVNEFSKFELLHSVATGLEMDKAEMMLFCTLERMGVFSDAETVTHCEDDVQLDRMLKGEGPGSEKTMSATYVLDELRKFLEKMEGAK